MSPHKTERVMNQVAIDLIDPVAVHVGVACFGSAPEKSKSRMKKSADFARQTIDAIVTNYRWLSPFDMYSTASSSYFGCTRSTHFPLFASVVMAPSPP